MNPNRLRAGAIAWLLTLQFFVVEALAALRVPGYSRLTDTISALGGLTSPAHRLMNASFLLQGVLIFAGTVLLRPALRGRAARVAPVLLTVSAIGVGLVGIFPLDTYTRMHAAGAVLHLVGAGVGLLALAYGLRPRSEALGTTVVLLGLISTAMTVFFLVGATDYLGRGGTERGAAYAIPLALALTGAYLWRFGVAVDATDARQLARQEKRELKARRDAERDAALEAAAARAEAERTGGAVAGAPATAEVADPDPELDPDDPWATPGRRRRD